MIESKGAAIKSATVIKDPEPEQKTIKPSVIKEMIAKRKQSSVNHKSKNTKFFLSHEESAQLSANHAKHEILKQERKLLELRKILITSQENTLKRDRIILDNDVNNINRTDQKFKDKNEKFLSKITKKYSKLNDGNWSYNPQTGEIIIND